MVGGRGRILVVDDESAVRRAARRALEVLGYHVREAALSVSDLLRADSCFITSSTRDVLGVAAIEGKPLKQDAAFVESFHQAFAKYVEDYVRAHPRRAAQRSAV